jgi:RNA polymerase sigma-70 factor (ECF subfamily)
MTIERSRMHRMASANRPALRRLVRRLGVRLGDEEDVTQRVLLTAWRKLGQFDVHSERSFLHAIAVREASHQCRTYRRRREISGEAGSVETGEPAWSVTRSSEPDELLHLKRTRTLVGQILEQLTPELRQVFVLFVVNGSTASEIARMLELPIGTVKSRLRRAREAVGARVALGSTRVVDPE